MDVYSVVIPDRASSHPPLILQKWFLYRFTDHILKGTDLKSKKTRYLQSYGCKRRLLIFVEILKPRTFVTV